MKSFEIQKSYTESENATMKLNYTGKSKNK